MSWEGLAGHGITCSPSCVETERFGISIGRVVVGDEIHDATDVAAELTRVLTEADEDLLVVRWPARLAALGAAAAASPRRILPADVLTYWEVPAAQLRVDPEASRAAGCSIRGPQEGDGEAEDALRTVVADSFRGYGNHYTANPMLDDDLALHGYLDWAVRSLRANPRDVLLLQHDEDHGPEVVGVATLALSADGRDLEILLAGLRGQSQGQGWYTHLLGAVGDEARRRGAERVIISTQVHNIRVQRAWARCGLRPFGAVTTVHAMR